MAVPPAVSTAHPLPSPASTRIGVDLVAVADVDAAVQRWGPRYLTRVFTARELLDCGRGGVIAVERLAARFAAKEAVVKVLAPRSHDPLPWTAIEVVRGPAGRPQVRLHGCVAVLARRRGVNGMAVSLAHDGPAATAVALATFDGHQGAA